MDEIEWWEFESSSEMAEQVAGDIGFVIESAIQARGGARIAVPGGRTAEEVFKALLANASVDWSKVTLIPTDERLVALDDDQSNYKAIAAHFEAKGAMLVSLVDEAALDDRRAAGRLADQRLAMLDWPLDLVWLAMGEDGHTAGIFPGPDFEAAVAGPKERRAVGVRPDPMPSNAAIDRVTLTAPALSSARAIMVVIEGDQKRQRLEEAIKEGPLSSKPIGRVLSEVEAGIDIFWTA